MFYSPSFYDIIVHNGATGDHSLREGEGEEAKVQYEFTRLLISGGR